MSKTEARKLAAGYERKAERQRLGLEPLPADNKMTLAEVVEWWLRERCTAPSLRREQSRLRHHVVNGELGRLPLSLVTADRVETFLKKLDLRTWKMKAGIERNTSPATVNHVRAKIRTVLNDERRAGKFNGVNPVGDTKFREIPKKMRDTLPGDSIPVMLANVPDRWRAFFATAIYTGLTKGELAGLRKVDVDLVQKIITVRHSYARESTKGGHEDKIPVAPALVPYLAAAIDNSKTDLVFPDENGAMISEEGEHRAPAAVGARAGGAGRGYDHICRRCKAKGTPHSERHKDAELRRCPRCGRARSGRRYGSTTSGTRLRR